MGRSSRPLPLPVEVIPFGLAATQRAIVRAFAEVAFPGKWGSEKGKDGHVFVTDGGHWIVDAHLGRITDAPRLARSVDRHTGRCRAWAVHSSGQHRDAGGSSGKSALLNGHKAAISGELE